MMLHTLARLLGRLAARTLHPVRPAQAMAMYAELEHLTGAKALVWAVGCLLASWRQRANVVSVTIVGARLCVAAAAGLFGWVHVSASAGHLWTKVHLLTSGVQAPCRVESVCTVATLPLTHWIWMFGVYATLGLLHLLIALLMAVGRNKQVLKLAMVIVGADLLMPVAGMGGITLSALYIGLIMLMAMVSVCLALLWRWDERRMALI